MLKFVVLKSWNNILTFRNDTATTYCQTLQEVKEVTRPLRPGKPKTDKNC